MIGLEAVSEKTEVELPRPRAPNPPAPQQVTFPISRRTQVIPAKTAICLSGLGLLKMTGLERTEGVVTPHWPLSLTPKHAP